ncbi:hypothetical protein K435DRAFT_838095 [Dendrothele bispora CBS 962.96]|uniref:Uncharacterized protein n=1 Tax=Dendrothele bispora (strain CBS 962.96) TaxID=1314807 RepID=A0A4V4HGF2_DENBC|nr:hypothetical protein K435DRAFT_838095 [Dendrothele bispora CBS 962.96]
MSGQSNEVIEEEQQHSDHQVEVQPEQEHEAPPAPVATSSSIRSELEPVQTQQLQEPELEPGVETSDGASALEGTEGKLPEEAPQTPKIAENNDSGEQTSTPAAFSFGLFSRSRKTPLKTSVSFKTSSSISPELSKSQTQVSTSESPFGTPNQLKKNNDGSPSQKLSLFNILDAVTSGLDSDSAPAGDVDVSGNDSGSGAMAGSISDERTGTDTNPTEGSGPEPSAAEGSSSLRAGTGFERGRSTSTNQDSADLPSSLGHIIAQVSTPPRPGSTTSLDRTPSLQEFFHSRRPGSLADGGEGGDVKEGNAEGEDDHAFDDDDFNYDVEVDDHGHVKLQTPANWEGAAQNATTLIATSTFQTTTTSTTSANTADIVESLTHDGTVGSGSDNGVEGTDGVARLSQY